MKDAITFVSKNIVQEKSDWKCTIFGDSENGFIFIPNKDKEPNWFWRKMQYFIFGHRWEKIK